MFLGYTHYILNRYNSLTSNVFSLDFKKDRLPEGWVNIPFKNLVKKIPLTGRKIKQKEYLKNGTIPIIDQGQDFIGGYTEDTKKIVNCNLPVIVFGDHTKSIKFVDCEFAAGADGIKVLEPNPNLNQKWLYYFMQAIQLPDKNYARHYQYLEKAVMNIPPFTEQKRIVAKLESIFAQIDAVKEQLEMLVSQTKSVSGSLNALRNSVLKQAFEGKLVPQDPHDEPAEALLKRIHKNSKIESEKANLPNGWATCSLSEIAQINPSKPKNNSIPNRLEVSFVPMRNVEELTGNINLSETREYSKVKKGYTYFQDDDLIFAKITPCMENGKIAIVTGLKNRIGFGSTEFHVIRLKNSISRKFYFLYFIQDDFRNKAQHKMKGTAGQLRVPLEYMKNTLIPLPPLNEQKRIVAKIESVFARIGAIEEHVEFTLVLIDRLKNSTLKSAFEGRLVPQDPDDEPAKILLQKIRQEKEQISPKTKSIRRNKRRVK